MSAEKAEMISQEEVMSKVNKLWDHRIYVVPDAMNNFTQCQENEQAFKNLFFRTSFFFHF